MPLSISRRTSSVSVHTVVLRAFYRGRHPLCSVRHSNHSRPRSLLWPETAGGETRTLRTRHPVGPSLPGASRLLSRWPGVLLHCRRCHLLHGEPVHDPVRERRLDSPGVGPLHGRVRDVQRAVLLLRWEQALFRGEGEGLRQQRGHLDGGSFGPGLGNADPPARSHQFRRQRVLLLRRRWTGPCTSCPSGPGRPRSTAPGRNRTSLCRWNSSPRPC